ncbi:MAG: exodeoxyribonuclease III [Alphaproteobacteria bacterium]|nr:exodeoxyribonuclease III [Alphaproteobacteria bacterium]
MKILTWNINSVRLRAPLALRIIAELGPDIVCLQETKCPDEQFPLKEFTKAGYGHAHYHGMKGYNGVAVLSKIPFHAVRKWDRVSKSDCRHIAIEINSQKFKKPVQIHNLYVPAGGDIPDVTANDKFAHKLDFVDELKSFFASSYAHTDPMVAVGDFNIAPLEHDVWSHKQLLDVVSHTPIEVEKLTAMFESVGWVDAIRTFVPENEKLYTWWSYRNRDWKISNRGRRLDHIWVTEPLKTHLKGYTVFKEARDWQQPSDHVPVMAEIDL